MKTLLILFLLLATPASAMISATSKDILNRSSGSGPAKVQLGTLLDRTKAVFKFIYDATASDGGVALGMGSITVNGGTHAIPGASLPAKAVITNSYLEVLTQFASSSGSSTVAFQCENSGDVKAAADIDASPAGTFLAGTSLGDVATMQKMAAACTLKALVGVENLTAGKAAVFVEYVISN
jgi:hypothetical protein